MTGEVDHVALEAIGVSKAFPGVQALADVAMTLCGGEIHALVGENGAGKSTLIKIITGLYQPDAGQVKMFGKNVKFVSPRAAIEAGIGMVPQERNLIPAFSVGENILLEKTPTQAGMFVDYSQVNREAQKWLDVMKLDISPATVVADLSAAQMQLVETAKALALNSQVLLLDEPTAAITPHEVSFLFEVLRGLRDRGVAILFVTHKLEEVFELCDRVTVLRDGRNVASGEKIAGLTRDQLITWMIGRSHVIGDLPERQPPTIEPVLEARGLYAESGTHNVSFQLHGGEVLGLYGLVGAGRTELAHALIGASKLTGGELLVRGKPARPESVAAALGRYKIGYVSENRKTEGLILSHSILFNVSITIWRRIARLLGWISGAQEKSIVLSDIEKLDVKTPSLAQAVGNLSGGNQQKVSIAKWLAAKADILIFDEPTIGIDIKTKYALHDLIWDLSGQGKAVLLISSDMPEMIRLADRILVMKDDCIISELPNTHQYDEMSTLIMQDLA
jgi:ribose transport system ATP-binding protein